MIIQENEELILIRYSDMYGKDTIKEHKKIMEKQGYCWFGKIGKKSSKGHINELLKMSQPKILLVSKQAAYVAEISDIGYDIPESNYPIYYKEELFAKNVYPSIYFKMIGLKKIDKSLLNNFIVKSSINSVLNALAHSMTSQLLIKCEKETIVKEKKENE